MGEQVGLGRVAERATGLPRSLAQGVALFALLALLLYTPVLHVLPGYPATVVSFAAWLVLPGWAAARGIFDRRASGFIERLTYAFVASIGLAALPGLLALRLHWSLETFGLLYALLAAVATAGAPLLGSGNSAAPVEEQASALPRGALVALLALVVAAALTTPYWLGDRIPRDGDDIVYIGYVNEYQLHSLDPSAPFAKQGAFARISVDVWLPLEALTGNTAGASPQHLVLDYLPPLLLVLALAATYTLTKGIGRGSSVALLAAALVIGYALVDLTSHEGFGRNIFLRIAQDKMVATYVLLPAALVLPLRFAQAPGPRAYLAYLVATMALTVVHPMGAAFLLIATLALVLLRAALSRTRAELALGAALIAPWVGLALLFLLRGRLIEGIESDPTGLSFLFRREYHVVDLPGDMIMGNYHMLFHPLMIAAVLIAPLLWLRARSDPGGQLLLAVVAGVVLVFFTPPLATALVKVADEQALWRLPRLLPVAVILAVAVDWLAAWLAERRLPERFGALLAPAGRRALASLGGVAFLLALALVVQEQYVMADGGAFFERTSTTRLLPWTDGSILVGGYQHAALTDARPSGPEQAVLNYLADHAPPGSTVIAPRSMRELFPGFLDGVRSLDDPTAPDFPERQAISTAFYGGFIVGDVMEEAVRRWNIGYVVGTIEDAHGTSYYVDTAGGGLDVVAREQDGPPLTYLTSFSADDFILTAGAPKLETQGSSWEQFSEWTFGGNSRNVVALDGGFRIPQDAAEGPLSFSIQFAPGSANAAGRVEWGVWTPHGGGIAVGDNFDFQPTADADFGVFTYSGLHEPGERLEMTIETGDDGTFAPGDLVRFAVFRRGDAGTDTSHDPAWLVEVDVYYQREDR